VVNSVGEIEMSSEEKAQFIRAMNTVLKFVKIHVKEYPLVFKKCSGDIKVEASMNPFFPYEVALGIRKKE